MAGPWESYEPSTLRVPIRGPFGQLMAREAGKMRDEEMALLRVALLSRLPSRCPDDALDAVGANLAIPRYPGQDNASYRACLMKAWSTHEKAGSAEGVEEQIAAALGCDVHVYMIDEMDFGPDHRAAYSEFWTVIGPNLGTFTATAAQIAMVKRIVLKWKASHSYAVELIVIDDTSGSGSILGFCELGSAVLGSSTSTRYRIGRTLGGTLPPLGDPACILGGYFQS